MMDKKRVMIAAAGILGVAIVLIVLTRSYPVLFVGWRPISYNSFALAYHAAITYYGRALETYDRPNTQVLKSDEVQEEVRRAILDKLVEDHLVSRELVRRMPRGEVRDIVLRKISEATAGADITQEVRALYGLTLREFSSRVLAPQAERETLEGRLILEDKKIEDWLREAKSRARVVILLSGFEWNGKEIVGK